VYSLASEGEGRAMFVITILIIITMFSLVAYNFMAKLFHLSADDRMVNVADTELFCVMENNWSSGSERALLLTELKDVVL
jgi:hypothetical protein